MRKFVKWTLLGLGGLFGAVLLLAAAMTVSTDVRYGVIYELGKHVDLNLPVPQAALDRQIAALKRADLVDQDGKPFDWNARPHAVIWFNEWAHWCVPCRMELPAMKALQGRVGRDRLRIVLFSQPKDWEADKTLAKDLGLDFELVTARNPAEADLAAINLAKRSRDFLLPETTFLRADGRGLIAMHELRDWDSAEWQANIERWYRN
ncbi:MAG TPA: TlpA disulfide reductase family protein [Rhizomicrobium sp.]|jgi:thiol-disulfide isomerase/thioredoxin